MIRQNTFSFFVSLCTALALASCGTSNKNSNTTQEAKGTLAKTCLFSADNSASHCYHYTGVLSSQVDRLKKSCLEDKSGEWLDEDPCPKTRSVGSCFNPYFGGPLLPDLNLQMYFYAPHFEQKTQKDICDHSTSNGKPAVWNEPEAP